MSTSQARGTLEDNDNNDDGNNDDGDNLDKRSKARGTFEVRSLKKTPHLYWFCFALHSSPFLSLGQNFLAVTRERAAQQTRITS